MLIRTLSLLANDFCSLRSLDDLADLLRLERYQLELLAAQPIYNCFDVPKKDGSKRHIEDPQGLLKEIQSSLNDYLQAILYLHRNPYAYGFMIVPDDDPAPRHIVSNAQRHVGAFWLLNIDLEDFFHSVSWVMVRDLLGRKPFSLPNDLCYALASLCTYKARLPMGAPTSPVLSNFATVALDNAMSATALSRQWTYTRYADDMSFSSSVLENPILETDLALLSALIRSEGFEVNAEKVKLMAPNEPKIVTGIQLGRKAVTLPEPYYQKIEQEIDKLAHVVLTNLHLEGTTSDWVRNYAQQLQGMLQFAEKVMGAQHPRYQSLYRRYKQALEPPKSAFGAVSWLDFPYL